MFAICFYFGSNKIHFQKIEEKVRSINSSAEIIQFTNLYHLLSTLRCYEHFIQKTAQPFPTHIFIDELPGSKISSIFIDAFEALRLENHEIYEIELVPVFSKNDAVGDRSQLLELDYVHQYIENDDFELHPNKNLQMTFN